MNKVLIMHHVEPMWQNAMLKKGVHFTVYLDLLYEHIRENHYDKLILTQFEEFKLQDIHIEYGFGDLGISCYEYGYGWPSEALEGCGESSYIEGGNHSEVVYVPDWLKELKGNDVYLCGAFDGECIEDMEIALRHCVGDFTRINSLIV